MQRNVAVTHSIELLQTCSTWQDDQDGAVGPKRLLGVLKQADKSFELTGIRAFRAINAAGEAVSLIPQTRMQPSEQRAVAEPILSAPTLRQFAIASNGKPFELEVPDPRNFLITNAWLSSQPEREPVARTEDVAQAQIVARLVVQRLPGGQPG